MPTKPPSKLKSSANRKDRIGRGENPPTDLRFDENPQFNQIRTRRIFEEICEQVRGQMSSGVLRPGDKLPAERDLAVQFGVSRTAVREALRSLEIAGIVGLQKGIKGGAFILKGDLDLITRSMKDMFYLGRLSLDGLTEARVIILKAAVALVCSRMSPKMLAAFEQNVEDLSALPRDNSVTDRLEVSAEFYDLLAEATGNEVLQIIMESLSAIVLQRIADRPMAAMPNLVSHRRKLVGYLAKGEVEAAQAEIGAHLQRLHKHLINEERSYEQTILDERKRADRR